MHKINLVIITSILLTACTSQSTYAPYAGPIAPPQIAYRIDDNRYFEVVPLENMACARARLYYSDKIKGIHTNVASWDRVSDGTFVIDAANDQYLVAPIILSSSGCQTGDSSSFKCASRLPYSTDAGKTWKFNIPRWSGGNVYMAGNQIYNGGAKSSVSELREGYVPDIWHEGLLSDFGKPSKPPVDTKLHCNR
jgi:hypothetical protein